MKQQILTSEQIAKKYQDLTRVTPTDERYIWRTQTKWIQVNEVLELMEEVKQSEIKRCNEANAFTCWGILRKKLEDNVR